MIGCALAALFESRRIAQATGRMMRRFYKLARLRGRQARSDRRWTQLDAELRDIMTGRQILTVRLAQIKLERLSELLQNAELDAMIREVWDARRERRLWARRTTAACVTPAPKLRLS